MDDFQLDAWHVSPSRNLLIGEGQVRYLEPRQMNLLVFLASRPGVVVSLEQIVDHVWPNRFVSDSAVLSAISTLRRKLGDTPANPRYLETIRKRGYRLITSVARPTACIAVLPLRDLAMEPAPCHLADGLTELLIGELGRSRAGRIIAFSSVLPYRGSTDSLASIGGRLGAGWIVTGTVLRARQQCHVTIEIVQTPSTRILWAERFSAPLDDLLGLAQEIGAQVIDVVSVGDAVPPATSASTPIAVEALDAYLAGRQSWWRFTRTSLDHALACFLKSIRLAPNFADAHAGVADVWGATGYWGLKPASLVRDAVYSAASTAAAIDPASAAGPLLLGCYHFYYARDFDAAMRCLSQAVTLNPSLAQARLARGLLLAALMDRQAGFELDEATRLDPENPVVTYARALWWSRGGIPPDAGKAIDRALSPAFDHRPSLQLRADLAWLSGRDDQARTLECRCWVDWPELVALLENPRHSARRAVGEAAVALARQSDRFVAPIERARLHLHGRQLGQAAAVLCDGIEQDEVIQIDQLSLNPIWRELRSTWAAVRRRLDLPP